MPITELPPTPNRAAPATFSDLADAFLAALATFQAEANALETNVNAKEVLAAASAVAAAASEAVALAAANYVGPWADQTGAANVPYAVSHLDRFWQLASSLADVTTKTPGTDAEWLEITPIDDSAYSAAWNGSMKPPTQNAVYDEMQKTQLIRNLKPAVNVAVNKLDIFTKSGGAAPDANNTIQVAIPDGNGYTFRSRAAAYLSGTSQFIMADATDYWSKGSLDAEIKTAYIYAIWDGTGIVWALGGYSGFTRVPASTTATDDDFFLLEEGSTYTKVVTDYCVAIAKIRYQYDTADDPDHTIQATVLDAPQVCWNPKSDYGKTLSLAASNAGGAADIATYSAVNCVLKQSRSFLVSIHATAEVTGGTIQTIILYIKLGSSTYASAVEQGRTVIASPVGQINGGGFAPIKIYANAGDTLHLGVGVAGTAGNRTLLGDNAQLQATHLTFIVAD